jgi:hypothetical protein
MYQRAKLPKALSRGLGLSRLRGARGRRRSLGCQECVGKNLGQDDGDITDVFSDSYDPFASVSATPTTSLPIGAGTITTMDEGGNLITSNPNPYELPGLTSSPIYPSSDTGYVPGSLSPLTAGVSSAGSVLRSVLAPTQSPFILGSSTGLGSSATATALASYMPLIILGLGGIALIAVLKKR